MYDGIRALYHHTRVVAAVVVYNMGTCKTFGLILLRGKATRSSDDAASCWHFIFYIPVLPPPRLGAPSD